MIGIVKSLVDEFNQNNEYAIAVISLFGIDSISMLHERVKDEYLGFSSGLLGKTARKVFRIFRKLTNESANFTLCDSAKLHYAVRHNFTSAKPILH